MIERFKQGHPAPSAHNCEWTAAESFKSDVVVHANLLGDPTPSLSHTAKWREERSSYDLETGVESREPATLSVSG